MKKLVIIALYPLTFVLSFIIFSCNQESSSSWSELTNYLRNGYRPEIENRDSVYQEVLHKLKKDMENEHSSSSAQTHKPYGRIDNNLANCLHKLYKERIRDPRDTNLASCIPLDTFLHDVVYDFGNEINLCDSMTWRGKSFIIYFANYGEIGNINGTATIGKHQTTAIIQFAKVKDPKTLIAKENTYDFGDLKPPKIVMGGLSGNTTFPNCIQN